MDPKKLHDRSLEFLRTCFHWDRPPKPDDLLEVAGRVSVDVRIGAPGAMCAGCQLTFLALVNLLARLPVRVRVALSDAPLARHVPPYQGECLSDAVVALARGLGREIDIAPCRSGRGIELSTGELWSLLGDGWSGHLRQGAHEHVAHEGGNPLGAYSAASLAAAEAVRAWARAAGASGSGTTGARFNSEARPVVNASVNLWRPRTDSSGPSVDGCLLPEIDWVSAGAVNQAALAVLAGLKAGQLRGRIVDPKLLDPPDLNRSLLSFARGIDRPKAEVSADALDAVELQSVKGYYPQDVNGPRPDFLVCGTDDVRVRPACQQLRPERLVIIATEGPFGRVSWHGSQIGHVICGGCQAVGVDGPTEEGVPTIGAASTAAGIVGAAWILRLLTDPDPVPRQAGILTTRMDSPFGIEETNPSPRPDCVVCSGG